MSLSTIAGLVALGASLLARRRRRRGMLDLDDWAFAASLQLGVAGVIATVLACCGVFGPRSLAIGCTLAALALWPWTGERERCPPAQRPTSLAHTGVLAVILLAGVLLRLPPIAAPLAGRDQGSYALRAAAALRTGELGWTDEVLAAAGRELDGRATPAGALDLLGLYPVSDEPWRAQVYEGAYRPGSYLASRERGLVVAQFFHLHPMMLAVGGAAFGPRGIELVPIWTAALGLLCLLCVARRLWPRGAWAALALALVAGSPLAIWVARTPLSENPMALFEGAALLAALHLREGGERARAASWLLAACLALSAGVRGNALVMLPVVLAIAWLRTRDDSGAARAAYLVLAGLCASAWLHVLTSFPYVHDEILRRAPVLAGGTRPFMFAVLAGALGWVLVDRLTPRELIVRARGLVLRTAPLLLALTCFAAASLWAGLALTSPAGAPYSRLDAAPVLLGWPLLGLAALGLAGLARSWRPRPRELWLVALAAVVPATALLYAPRGLPTLAFFYYGRYLVPELLPAAALLACFALAQLNETLGHRRPRLARVLAGALALALLASVCAPLLMHPQLRLREYQPAAEAVDWLATRLPADAVVIAGGEGWHNGHTYNQIGGALALSRGVSVLPYRTREDAWISAWELLVAGPERRQEPPPPVYMLLNEAAHPIASEHGGGRRALLDDLLWAPFVVEEAALLELYVHALSPTPDSLPTRVARHELRMALLELRVDPEARAAITKIELEPGAASCVSPQEVLRLELPRPANARHLVLVAGEVDAKMARRVPRWRVRINGELMALDPPKGLRPHARATLGPLPLPPPDPGGETGEGETGESLRLEIRGADMGEAALGEHACPHGRLAAVYLLPRERAALAQLDAHAVTTQRFSPAEDLGHAIGPTHWVSGRSLSRYRPGTTPAPDLVALALRLEPGAQLAFRPIDIPLGSGTAQGHDPIERPPALDVVVTLARTHARAGAALRVYADDLLVGRVELPPARVRSWVAPALRWHPVRDRAQLRVELEAGAGGSVELRDLALYAAELARSGE